MAIITDLDQVQKDVAAGGWDIFWGDLINEVDAFTFLVSLPTGTTAAWIAGQVEIQLQKFAQSSEDVSTDVLDEAARIATGIVEGKWLGEWDVNGLEVKGGIATYRRWWKFKVWIFKWPCKRRLPNNYQPYIGLRVKQPLPPKGTPAAPQWIHTNPITGGKL